MKTVSDDLFRLIRSLNKPEKGFFKKYAAKNAASGKQNYITLFDAIDKMEEYDEEKLRKQLKNESFIKQLPVYKVYLFNLILKSLHLFGSVDNAESRLTEMLINVKILNSRALYKEAAKQLKKAKELAYKFNNMRFILETLSLERSLILFNPDKSSFEKRKNVYKEQQDFILRLNDYYDFNWYCDWMTILVDQKADFKEGEKIKEMDKIISAPLMQTELIAGDYNTKLFQIHTHLLYHSAKRDNERIHEYLKKEILLAEKNRHIIDDNPQNYSFALINFLLCSSTLNRRNDVRETIIKLGNLRRRLKNKISQQQEINIFLYASNIEMLIYENNCDLKRGRIKAKAIEKDLKKFGEKVPAQRRIILLTDLAYFYFTDEDYDTALKFINTVLNEASSNFRSDVYEFSRIFQLLVHFELGNYDLLEYLVDSVNKFFKEKKKTLKQEAVVIEFFRKAVKAGDDDMAELYDETLYKLKKEKADEEKEGFLIYYDFPAWIESKIEGRKFIDIMKEKRGV